MQTYGGIQFKALPRRILGRFVGSMKGMKGVQTQHFSDWKFMPLFEYEPLVMFPKPDTSKPLDIRVPKELGDSRGGKDSLKREDVGQTLKQVEYVL
jgi:hypothetical protein